MRCIGSPNRIFATSLCSPDSGQATASRGAAQRPAQVPGQAAGARRRSPASRRRSPATERKHIRSKTSGAGIQKAAATWPSRVRRKSPGPKAAGARSTGAPLASTSRAPGPSRRKTDARVRDVDGQVVRRRRAPPRAPQRPPAAAPAATKSISSSGDIQATPRSAGERPPGAAPASRSRSPRATAAASRGVAEVAAQRDHADRRGARCDAGSAGDGLRHPAGSLPCRGRPGRRPSRAPSARRRPGSSSTSPMRPAPPAISAMAIERPSVGEK